MLLNPYVVKTIQLFRIQALAAKAVGDAGEEAAFEEAIRSLLEDGGPLPEAEPVSVPVVAAS